MQSKKICTGAHMIFALVRIGAIFFAGAHYAKTFALVRTKFHVKSLTVGCHKLGNVQQHAPMQKYSPWWAPVQKLLHRCALERNFPRRAGGACTIAHRCGILSHNAQQKSL